jgi:hypothetical protein
MKSNARLVFAFLAGAVVVLLLKISFDRRSQDSSKDSAKMGETSSTDSAAGPDGTTGPTSSSSSSSSSSSETSTPRETGIQDGKIALDHANPELNQEGGPEANTKTPGPTTPSQPSSTMGANSSVSGGGKVAGSGKVASDSKVTSVGKDHGDKKTTGDVQPASQEPVQNTPPKKRFNAEEPTKNCDGQWQDYVAAMHKGVELVYMTSMAVQKPIGNDISVTHIESVAKSGTDEVKRSMNVSSEHPTGTLVLTTLEMMDQISVNKGLYQQLCSLAEGRAIGSSLFGLSNAKIVSITDAQIQVGLGSFSCYKVKMDAQVVVGKKTKRAVIVNWVDKKRPGLVVKQQLKFPESVFPDHGAITLVSELAGGKL